MPAPESINIYMNQGVVVDLSTTSVYSGQFSTCAPIVMYNHNTHKAGYYHIGGLRTDLHFNQAQQEAIQHLLNHVQPTHVFILAGKGTHAGYNTDGDSAGHLKPVTDLVEEYDENISIHYQLDEFVMQEDPSGHLLSKSLTINERDFATLQLQLPANMLDGPRVTAVGGLKVSEVNGHICFSPEQGAVEISLNDSSDVTTFMAMMGTPNCFVGDPEGLGQFQKVSGTLRPDNTPPKDVVSVYAAEVSLKRYQFDASKTEKVYEQEEEDETIVVEHGQEAEDTTPEELEQSVENDALTIVEETQAGMHELEAPGPEDETPVFTVRETLSRAGILMAPSMDTPKVANPLKESTRARSNSFSRS